MPCVFQSARVANPDHQAQQIERAKDRTGERAMTADQLENGKPILVANDGLSINQARPNRKLADGHRHKGKAMRELVSSPRNQPHARTIAPGENTEAIVLDFVKSRGRNAAL